MKRIISQHVLLRLVLRDYRLREKGLGPDRWHWADMLLLRWGYAVGSDDQLVSW